MSNELTENKYEFKKQNVSLPFSDVSCLYASTETGGLYIAKTIDADESRNEITMTGVEIKYKKFRTTITDLR